MKEKISNLWYHYKVPIVVGIALVLLLVIGLRSCSNRRVPDMKMVYFSDNSLSSDSSERLENYLTDAKLLRDIDGDGEVNFYLEEIVSTFDIDEPMDEGTMSKIQTTFYAGEHTIMLAHKYALEDYDGCFEDISSKVRSGEKTFVSPEGGFVTGISVEGNTLLENAGINTKDLYITMRLRTDKEKGKHDKHFNLAYEVMDHILSFNEVAN